METYRGYKIEPCFIYSDGKIDGHYFLEGDEENAKMIFRQTIEEVKDEIHERVFNQEYPANWIVQGRENYTISIFFYLSNAINYTVKTNGIHQFNFNAP